MPARKVPKALQDILAKVKSEKPPEDNGGVAAILGKGIKGSAIEAGSGENAALISIANEGPNKQISLLTPFGRPAAEQNTEPPLLQAEDAEIEILESQSPEEASAFDSAWNSIADEIAPEEVPIEIENPPDETVEEIDTEIDPFADPEPIETPQEKATEELDQVPTENQHAKVIQELDELRKANQSLQEVNALLSHKKGAEATLKALELAKFERDQANRRLRKLLEEKNLKADSPQVLGEPPPLVAGANPASSTSLPHWEGKQLQVLFPSYKGTNTATMFFMIALALDFGKEKIGFLPMTGDARISNARNRLAEQFLATKAEWSLWIDDDMVPTVGRPEFTRRFIGATPEEVPDSVLQVHVVDRLLKANQKLIGATYFGRRRYSYAMFKEGIDNPSAYDKAKRHTGEILPTEWVATGCLLVHRDVYLGIQKTHPELAPQGNRTWWDFFQEGEGESGGEDVMFCKRARKAGFQAYVDTGAQAFHIGFCSYGFHNTTAVKEAKSTVANREGKWW